MQDPLYGLQIVSQAALIPSIYYGIGSHELELPILAAASVFGLETVAEAVSIHRHWTKSIYPFGNKVCSKIANWLGF